MDLVSCVSCVSWMDWVNAAETYELPRASDSILVALLSDLVAAPR